MYRCESNIPLLNEITCTVPLKVPAPAVEDPGDYTELEDFDPKDFSSRRGRNIPFAVYPEILGKHYIFQIIKEIKLVELNHSVTKLFFFAFFLDLLENFIK